MYDKEIIVVVNNDNKNVNIIGTVNAIENAEFKNILSNDIIKIGI